MEPDLESLLAFPIFSGFSREEMEKIARHLRPQDFSPDQTVIREGEIGDQLYLLMEGTVSVSIRISLPQYLHDPSLQEEKGLIKYSGADHAIFGEHGLFGEEPSNRTATVTALTPCRLLELSRVDFEELTRQDTALSFKLARNLCLVLADRLRQANQDIAKLSTVLTLVLAHHRQTS